MCLGIIFIVAGSFVVGFLCSLLWWSYLHRECDKDLCSRGWSCKNSRDYLLEMKNKDKYMIQRLALEDKRLREKYSMEICDIEKNHSAVVEALKNENWELRERCTRWGEKLYDEERYSSRLKNYLDQCHDRIRKLDDRIEIVLKQNYKLKDKLFTQYKLQNLEG